jgi:hypothetical protein
VRLQKILPIEFALTLLPSKGSTSFRLTDIWPKNIWPNDIGKKDI